MTRTKDTFTITYMKAEKDGDNVVLKEATFTASDKAKSKDGAIKELTKKVAGAVPVKCTVKHTLYKMDDDKFYSTATIDSITEEEI